MPHFYRNFWSIPLEPPPSMDGECHKIGRTETGLGFHLETRADLSREQKLIDIHASLVEVHHARVANGEEWLSPGAATPLQMSRRTETRKPGHLRFHCCYVR